MVDPDRAALAEQYADAENLDARIRLHERYDRGSSDWWPWVFDHYEGLAADADVLEVGCGPGYLWEHNADRVPGSWDLLATDFSPGMAAEARTTLAEAGIDAAVAVAAAEALPLPDDSVDAVVATHMLSHTDCDESLPEIRRVLRPGGRLFATTTGEANLRELRALLRATTEYEPPSATTFSLETGPDQLARHFETVHECARDSHLRVPELEPLVAYAASLPGVGEHELVAFADLAGDRLDDGPLEITKSMGMLVGGTVPDR